MRLAALDIGTNTVRVLVGDADRTRLHPVHRGLEITRLGRGVDRNKRFEAEAVQATVDVTARFCREARDAGAESIRVAGTSALRDAADRDAFAEAVERTTGCALEVLSGDQEGRLAYLGATAELPGDGPFCVCDIGGGSTELIRGRRRMEAVCSIDVGSVRVRERFLPDDPPRPEQLAAAADFARGELARAAGAVGLTGSETLVGVAGTVTTIAALAAGLERYEPDAVHGMRLHADHIQAWTDRLGVMRVEQIRQLATMDPGRADVICAGAVILREVCGLGFGEILVSEHDILHGLILDLARR